jgi:hypothetical protein
MQLGGYAREDRELEKERRLLFRREFARFYDRSSTLVIHN